MTERGPGLLADPAAPPEKWGGRKAQQYVAATLRTYGTVCWLCGLPGATSADHVIPRSKGGAVYDLLNLGPSHRRCNESRGNREHAGAAAIVENGMSFFSRLGLDTHAQPRPFSSNTHNKTQIRNGNRKR